MKMYPIKFTVIIQMIHLSDKQRSSVSKTWKINWRLGSNSCSLEIINFYMKGSFRLQMFSVDEVMKDFVSLLCIPVRIYLISLESILF